MHHIKNLPAKQLMEGITGHYAHGSSMSFGYVTVKAGTDMPVHQHVHEQITYILEGQLDMLIDGQKHSLTAGMVYVIPSGTLHGAYAVTDCTVIDVFSPVREEYKTSTL
jgi:quercetin dioxygenase-like cupin family protein